jgi:hypothetical protein
MPADLAKDLQPIWQELAPLALARGTLTAEHVPRFRLLCNAVFWERRWSARILEEGDVYIAVTVDGAGQERQVFKPHALIGSHRGMMQRVEAGMIAFRMAPTGKAVVMAKEKPKSELEKLQARKLRAI